MGDLGSPSEKAGSPSQEYPLAMHLDIPKKNWACSQEHHPEVRGDSPVAVAVAAVADAAVSSTADAAACCCTMDEVIVCINCCCCTTSCCIMLSNSRTCLVNPCTSGDVCDGVTTG